MKWFNDIGCESIIIDQCGNLGGDPDLLSIIEFIGSDREINTLYSVPKNQDDCPLNYLKSDTVSQTAKKYQKGQYLYVSINKELYPGAVFKGTKENKKDIIFMTDIFSRSAGDISVNYFIGKQNKYKGYLGSNVYSSVVGCFDGREFGFISVDNSFPPNINKISESKNLIDQDGNPVSPFTFNVDWGQYFLRYSDRKYSQYKQNKEINLVNTIYSENSNALPISFEKTIFTDFGFLTNNRACIFGWEKLHDYPPNPKDPKTWRYLYLDAAISYINNKT